MPRKRIDNFNEIRDEIQRETDRVAGKNKGVIATPITLKIFSPHVLNLTLVDLPGITKVPVGDQPSNIEEQIREMVMTYIAKPSAIILAVTAANTDLANSDALQMARRVDPHGDRTIGVLTKLDLMDKGTNAAEVLQGKLVPLKLGYIAVVNRSQQDIITSKPMNEALKAEEEFFATHSLYKTLQGQCGSRFLATSLNRTLMHHIKNKLPDLRQKVSKTLEDAVKELGSFGSIPSGASKVRFTCFHPFPGSLELLQRILHSDGIFTCW
jgi:replication fork clamp-binding protein CrfC